MSNMLDVLFQWVTQQDPSGTPSVKMDMATNTTDWNVNNTVQNTPLTNQITSTFGVLSYTKGSSTSPPFFSATNLARYYFIGGGVFSSQGGSNLQYDPTLTDSVNVTIGKNLLSAITPVGGGPAIGKGPLGPIGGGPTSPPPPYIVTVESKKNKFSFGATVDPQTGIITGVINGNTNVAISLCHWSPNVG